MGAPEFQRPSHVSIPRSQGPQAKPRKQTNNGGVAHSAKKSTPTLSRVLCTWRRSK